jgi:F-type H+-transporting ATPase subunit a
MSKLPEAINYHLGDYTVLLMSFIVLGIITILSLLATLNLKLVPVGIQNIFEAIFDFIFNLVDSIIGKEGKSFYPLFIGLFLYIFFSNLLGLIPGFISPTANINTTLALALIVFFSTHFIGIKKNGLFKYLKSLAGHGPLWLMPFMLVIELISHITRPISLSFRLFGNMMAKEILLVVLSSLVILFFSSGSFFQKSLTMIPVIMLPLIYLLGTLVVFIQAFVFTVLSIFYIKGALIIHH